MAAKLSRELAIAFRARTVGERNAAWLQLWRRLLSQPPDDEKARVAAGFSDDSLEQSGGDRLP
jgi:hypothetical protein